MKGILSHKKEQRQQNEEEVPPPVRPIDSAAMISDQEGFVSVQKQPPKKNPRAATTAVDSGIAPTLSPDAPTLSPDAPTLSTNEPDQALRNTTDATGRSTAAVSTVAREEEGESKEEEEDDSDRGGARRDVVEEASPWNSRLLETSTSTRPGALRSGTGTRGNDENHDNDDEEEAASLEAIPSTEGGVNDRGNPIPFVSFDIPVADLVVRTRNRADAGPDESGRTSNAPLVTVSCVPAMAQEDTGYSRRKRNRLAAIIGALVVAAAIIATTVGIVSPRRRQVERDNATGAAANGYGPPFSNVTDNTVCSRADSSLRLGSIRAVIDPQGRMRAPTARVPSCGTARPSSAGLWYRFNGLGQAVKAYTCRQGAVATDGTSDLVVATQITIFTGTCQDLVCVDGNAGFCSLAGGGSLVSWTAKANTEYFVFVSATGDSDDYSVAASKRTAVRGEFILSISNGQGNDQCRTALTIPPDGRELPLLDGRDAALLQDSALTRSPPPAGSIIPPSSSEPPPPPCGYSSSSFAAPVDAVDFVVWWFSVSGTGSGLRASVCNEKTNIPARIAVYDRAAGGGCSTLACEVDLSDSWACTAAAAIDDDGAPSVSWRSLAGELYYVYVSMERSIRQQRDNASLFLSVEEFETSKNDRCHLALAIQPGDVLAGSTRNATRSASLPSCLSQMETTPGVYYSLTGSGKAMRASVCTGDKDTAALQVVQGCDDLVCVDSFDDQSNCLAEWVGEAGETYLLYVYHPIDTGSFVLGLEEVEPASNAVCSGALEVMPDHDAVTEGVVLSGRMGLNSGVQPSPNEPLECLLYRNISPTAPALWYSIRGTGRVLEVSTCSNLTSLDTFVAVMEGDCGQQTCQHGSLRDDACDSSQGASRLSFSSVEGEIYYVYVTGDLAENAIHVGTFGLTVRELGSSAHDRCENAHWIVPAKGRIYEGSNIGASPGPENMRCAISHPSNAGVFFRTVGTGAILRVALDYLYSHDPMMDISVRQGTTCEELTCAGDYVGTKYYDALPPSVSWLSKTQAVEWQSEIGESYWIYVAGTLGVGGTFGFELTEVLEPSSNQGNGCFNAFPLLLDDEVRGSHLDARTGRLDESCPLDSAQSGVWYRLEGRTEDAIVASTCSPSTEYDATIQLFSGDDCTALSCRDLPLHFACPDGSFGDTILLNADLSTQYFLLVKAKENLGFVLYTYTEPAPINDSCEKAIDLELSGSGLEQASTSKGTISFAPTLLCDRVESFAPGLWYKTRGSGGVLKASTCNNATSSPTIISVYSGVCSANYFRSLYCEGSALIDDDCEASSGVSWQTVEGVEYHIFVQGEGLSVVQFGLTIEEASSRRGLQEKIQVSGNNDCIDAVELIPRSSLIVGSTVGATASPVPRCRPDYPPEVYSAGVWFAIQGTGTGLRVSTCHAESTFAHTVRIYESGSTGGCANLTCVRSPSTLNPYECEVSPDATTSTKTWQSTLGTLYYLYIDGNTAAAQGQYGLTLEMVDIAPNDVCSSAQEINATETTTVFGSTLSATVDDETILCEGFYTMGSGSDQWGLRVDMPGLWYKLRAARGNAFRVSTCHQETDYDTKISLFRGNCDSLSCVDLNDDGGDCGKASSLFWRTSPGEVYYVLVHGYFANNRAGHFGLTIEEVTAPSNDACDSAIELRQTGIVDIGSTLDASVELEAPFCYLPLGTPGVWYSIRGTGKSFRASTCSSETTFDTRLAIFSGTGCNGLICVEANSDSTIECSFSGDASTVQWKSELNANYYILVYGAPGASGTFGLWVDEVDAPSNDVCLQATSLATIEGQSSSRGTTRNATIDLFAPNCNSVTTPKGAGVWYDITGNGGRVSAHFCSEDPEIKLVDLSFSVYTGPCYELGCTLFNVDEASCGNALVGRAISWATLPGKEYLLYVSSAANGFHPYNYELSVRGVDPPRNNACDSAQDIGIFARKWSITGSIFDAYVNRSVPICAKGSGLRGVWFQMPGSGKQYQVSTCAGATNYRSRISVFKGACDSLVCVEVNQVSRCESKGTVQWMTERNESYFVFIHGIGDSIGNFGLTVEEI